MRKLFFAALMILGLAGIYESFPTRRPQTATRETTESSPGSTSPSISSPTAPISSSDTRAPVESRTIGETRDDRDVAIEEAIQAISKSDVRSAVQVLEKAIGSHPKDARLLSELALIQAHALGDGSRAISLFARALEVDPSHEVSLQELVSLAGKGKPGDRKAAAEALEQVVASNPDALAPHRALADHYLKSGLVDKAAAIFSDQSARARKFSEKTADQIEIDRAFTLAAAGEIARAREILEPLAKKYPDDGALGRLTKEVEAAREPGRDER